MEKEINETEVYGFLEKNKDFDCCIISAYKPNSEEKENIERTNFLQLELVKRGYGFHRIVGVRDTGKGNTRNEIDFFVINDWGEEEEFLKDMLKMRDSYEQESILILPVGAIEDKRKPILYKRDYFFTDDTNKFNWDKLLKDMNKKCV